MPLGSLETKALVHGDTFEVGKRSFLLERGVEKKKEEKKKEGTSSSFYMEGEDGVQVELQLGVPVVMGRAHTKEQADTKVSREQCVIRVDRVGGLVKLSVTGRGRNPSYLQTGHDNDGVEIMLEAGKTMSIPLWGKLWLAAGRHPFTFKRRDVVLDVPPPLASPAPSRGQQIVSHALSNKPPPPPPPPQTQPNPLSPVFTPATLEEDDDEDAVEDEEQAGVIHNNKRARLEVVAPVPVDHASSDSVEETFQCPVCYQVLNRPHELPCCNRVFCFGCIEAWFSRNNSCPICRSGQSVANLRPSLAIARMIMQQPVTCKQCGVSTLRGSLDDHLRLCKRETKASQHQPPPPPRPSSTPTSPPPPPSPIELLLAMGFPESQARMALDVVGGRNVDLAAMLLLGEGAMN